jgi:hypothetical protein
MRVANSDWCASRRVVSVSSKRVCWRVHSANFSGPSSSSSCLVPLGGGVESCGGTGMGFKCAGFGLPATSLLPFTAISPRYVSSFVARSRRCVNWNNSGVSSRKLVVASPRWNVSLFTTFSRNGTFVFTPRMRNSRRARSMRWHACSKYRPHAVTLTSSES